ncbi:proton-coupled folate transporter isoform X1 [Tribolium castaneum]|uniref:Proton-coupled folate transporter-like Protein n=2 Tax=Tribolium castaneum TaxID=7070 RepID=D6WVQ3_TRICA|nr:PREDICTED: proton-coupled folate transporter isoform X1 [Tribolium castaneum]EFA08602.2 Proton-coupled folate transporter-like Protein [Tribolium castaneum]|eukprot:XP_966826.3 PREDICTED: proton-coupled folate transporter isoform X1 [Tribolium castaneum]
MTSTENITTTMPSPSWQPPERRSLLYYLKLITVEPTMVLYMMAFMTTSVVEQAFFVNKACRVNHGLNASICDNLTEYEELNKEVQVTVSDFHLYNDVAGHVVPIILALFMGAWSDKRGRKLPLLIGLTGKLYYSVMVVVNATQDTWPVEYIVYTATLPMAFTGADVAIFAAAFTYLVDISTQESRTMRVTLLEVCYLATMPTGIALGKVLFNQVVNKSYAVMFGINVALLFLAIVYSFLRLDWRTNSRQQPLSEAPNLFTDFFDYNHVVDTGKTLFKSRRNNQRCYLLILIAMMAFYTFQRDEKAMSYLYVQLIFKWTFDEFSNFRTVQSAIQDVFLLCAIPLMSRVLGWRDTIIIMIGALAHSVGRIFFATADESWMFYLGGVFAAIGPIVAPVIRSMVSKLVANSEKGKTLAVLAVADNAIPLISGTMYSKVYNATIHTHPNAIFYLTMATQMTVFVLILFIHVKAKDEYLIHEDEEVKTECLRDD